MAECGKGWTGRCSAAKGKKCRCKCGGANHGTKRPAEEGGRPTVALAELLNVVNPGETKLVRSFPYPGYFGKTGRCDLAVCGKVIIAVERADNPSASITNCAESLNAELRKEFGEDIIHVE